MKTVSKSLLSILIIIFIASCQSNKSSIIWVNSLMTDCDNGAGNAKCMQIYRGDNIDEAFWENFYVPIEGFEFETGFFQKIEINEVHQDPQETPADASTIQYVLISELDKIEDPRFKINTSWEAKSMVSQTIELDNNLPNMSIDLELMRIAGSDSCNRYFGNIETVTDKKIEFGDLGTSLMACLEANNKIAQSFSLALARTRSYSFINDTLTFYDEDGEQTIYFEKVE